MDNAVTLVRRFRRLDYLKISMFGAGLALFWATFHSLVLPARIQDLVPAANKNFYLGLASSLGLVIAMLVQPLAGALSDRSALPWGQRRPFIFLGTVLALVTLPWVPGAQAFLALLLVYCALQLFLNIAQAPFQAFIPDMVPAHRRGIAAGVKSFTEAVSVIVIMRVLAYWMGKYSTNTSQWLGIAIGISGGVLLVSMAATMLLVKERRHEPGAHVPIYSTFASAFSIDFRGRRDFLWFLVSRLLVVMSLGTLQTFAFYYLTDFLGVSAPAAVTSSIVVALVIGMLASIYPAAWASDRIGRKPVLVCSGLLGLSGMLLLLFVHDRTAFLVASALLGISSGSFVSTNWALATDLVPPGQEAAYLGLANVASAGAGAFARLAMGPVIDLFNSRSPGEGYIAMLVVCAVYFAAGTVLILKIGGRRKVKQATLDVSEAIQA
ncbi:MAG: MFS transporter [Chloroflexi bacterium]|nr:MFS transporter [Chloroflexota bacterium]